MDCSQPGSTVYRVSQARILEWVAISSSRGIFLIQRSNPSVLRWQVDSTTEPPRKPHFLLTSVVIVCANIIAPVHNYKLTGHSLEAERQARDSQRRKARACCSPGPRHRIFHQTLNRLPFANHVFLESWTVDICQEWHSLRSAPQRRKHASHPGLCS